MRSARKRILASNPAEVGSTFVVRTFAALDEFSGRVSLRSAMDEEFGLFTVYHSSGGAQRTVQLEHLTENPRVDNWRTSNRLLVVSVKAGWFRSSLVPRPPDHPPLLPPARLPEPGPRQSFPPLQTFVKQFVCRPAAATVAFLPVINPRAAPRCPNTAFGAAIRRWQASAKSSPPPMQ